VILKDVAFEDLQTVVKFMYHGIVNVSSDKLPGVLKVRGTGGWLRRRNVADPVFSPSRIPDLGSWIPDPTAATK
jgi:hypothetical protein